MQDKLTMKQLAAVSLMLFAMFFGAGNMIFPPTLGAMAGENLIPAMLGFVAGDAGLAVLAVAAVTVVGNNLDEFGKMVGAGFSAVFGLLLYLLIGPLFALPRTGTVAFEIAIVPFLAPGSSTIIPSLIFTAIFFGLAFYLSSNPNKIVDIVGKVLTPALLISIALIFGAALLNPFGTIGTATGGYAANPFITGFIEGYNALDGPAGLAFAAIVITAVQAYGVRDRNQIAKYTIISGVGAAILLAIVYYALAYLGACSGVLGTFTNGGQMLAAITSTTVGTWGVVLLGVTVILACLTTAIGLTTGFGKYISEKYPSISYKLVIVVTSLFSFGIANVGLTTLISLSLPVLLIFYPVTMVLIVQAFFHKQIGNHKGVYWGGVLCALFVSVIHSLGLNIGGIDELVASLPLYSTGMGWILPAIVGSVIGWFVPVGKR